MNFCDAKQKAFAQRVYFDLKLCRRWSKLNVYFDEINKWIFFLGKPTENESLIYVLPISNDEQLTVDNLFNLKSKLSLACNSNVTDDVQSVLMAIIANDFTLGYFKFSYGLPTFLSNNNSTLEPIENQSISNINMNFVNEMADFLPNTTASWD